MVSLDAKPVLSSILNDHLPTGNNAIVLFGQSMNGMDLRIIPERR
jgi:hypothetical protein